MKSTFSSSPGDVASGLNWFCFGVQCTLAIFAPSGTGFPLAGKPAWYALIIAGLPRIIANTLSVRLTEMACHDSYPRNSDIASPPGTFAEYLSCANIASPPRTAHQSTIPIVHMRLRIIEAPLNRLEPLAAE